VNEQRRLEFAFRFLEIGHSGCFVATVNRRRRLAISRLRGSGGGTPRAGCCRAPPRVAANPKADAEIKRLRCTVSSFRIEEK
jgi:hypothetical protein